MRMPESKPRRRGDEGRLTDRVISGHAAVSPIRFMDVTDAIEPVIRSRIRELILGPLPEQSEVAIDDARLVEGPGCHSPAVLEFGFSPEEEVDITLIDSDRTVDIRTTREVEDYVISELRTQTMVGQDE